MNSREIHFKILTEGTLFHGIYDEKTVVSCKYEAAELDFFIQYDFHEVPLHLIGKGQMGDSVKIILLPYRIELYINDILMDEEWPFGNDYLNQCEITDHGCELSISDSTYEKKEEPSVLGTFTNAEGWKPEENVFVGDCMPYTHDGVYHFIIDHGSVHNYQNCKNLKLINCLFMPEVVDPVLGDCISFDELMHISMIRYYKHNPEFTPVNSIFYDDDKKVLHLLEDMMEEYERKDLGYQEIFRGKLMEILFLTMRKGLQKNVGFSVRAYDKSQLILDAIKYLESNYKNKAPLRQFCEEKHYSSQYVSKQFKKETGLTFLEYLQKVRIKKSCELLIGSELSVLEAAYQVGYDDLKYFQEIFKKIVGMSPREYRKAARIAGGSL